MNNWPPTSPPTLRYSGRHAGDTRPGARTLLIAGLAVKIPHPVPVVPLSLHQPEHQRDQRDQGASR
ncbi:hypothetical protein ABZ671_20045 [Micromonospora sp. NPDC006766]|uniref:hypothetical protein n=1 Tax=Micromonospora sp. NPDC006766 TaxID=3154778 RepID=UPI0033D38D5D